MPLDLIELGPSAGLNLVFDRYGYRYAEGSFGDPDARLAFDATERGRVPADLLLAPLEIRSRRGIDLAPIDVATAEGSVLLHSFLWPGLTERAARLDAAIATLLESPSRPELLQGDYVDRLPGAPGSTTGGRAHGRLPDGLHRVSRAGALRPVARLAR